MKHLRRDRERRHSRRFATRDGIVFLENPESFFRIVPKKRGGNRNLLSVLSSRHMKIGEIVNISEGGLSFYYFTTDQKINNLDAYKLSIEFKEENFSLNRLPFCTRNDFKVSGSLLGLRQRCVQFGRLQENQSIRLAYLFKRLIKNYKPGPKELTRYGSYGVWIK